MWNLLHPSALWDRKHRSQREWTGWSPPALHGVEGHRDMLRALGSNPSSVTGWLCDHLASLGSVILAVQAGENLTQRCLSHAHRLVPRKTAAGAWDLDSSLLILRYFLHRLSHLRREAVPALPAVSWDAWNVQMTHKMGQGAPFQEWLGKATRTHTAHLAFATKLHRKWDPQLLPFFSPPAPSSAPELLPQALKLLIVEMANNLKVAQGHGRFAGCHRE